MAMEKIVITPALTKANEKSKKRLFIIIGILLLTLVVVYIYQFFVGNEPVGWFHFLHGVNVGLLVILFFLSFSKKHNPMLELDQTKVKAHQPKDLGYKEENFEISTAEVKSVEQKYNALVLHLKSGETKQIQLGRFGYADAQTVKKFFSDLLGEGENDTDSKP